MLEVKPTRFLTESFFSRHCFSDGRASLAFGARIEGLGMGRVLMGAGGPEALIDGSVGTLPAPHSGLTSFFKGKFSSWSFDLQNEV